MGKLFSLIVIAGLAYGGLYFYYGMSIQGLIEEQVDDFGLGGLEVQGVQYDLMAPLKTETNVSANVIYRGAEATLDIRVHGHPLFSDEVQLELGGLQALQVTIGAGN